MQQPWKIRLHLEEREEKTIFLKLANQIIQEILSGRLGQGTRLLGSRTLSDELGINRKTVSIAHPVANDPIQYFDFVIGTFS